MPQKSARMIRARKHTVILQGKSYSVIKAEIVDGVVVIDLGEGGVIRRPPGAKLEVK